MALSERLNNPISDAELERRWRAVRAVMEKEKIDVLLMQNNNDHMGGYVRYFTDMPATNGYPNTVVFPRDDQMTVVCQGPFGGSEATAQGDQSWRGVNRILTTPSYASADYTKDYDPELAATALKPFAKGTIGYVGTYQMSYAMLDYIKRAFPQARFVDATDMVDRIKVIKSPEEMELVKRAALMQDGAMRAAFAAVKPGMRDIEVAAVAQHYSQCHGSENGIYLCASMPLGKPSKFANRHLQNRVIQKGDQIALLVEDNGPGGMYTELGRSCVVGTKVPQAANLPKLNLTNEQREQIRKGVLGQNTEVEFHLKTTKSAKDFTPQVGTKLPKGVTGHSLPPAVLAKLPQLRDYKYVTMKDQVLIVNAMTKTIVDLFSETKPLT